MQSEMQMHLELRIEKNIAAGMEPEEARYAAIRAFGAAGPFGRFFLRERADRLVNRFLEEELP